MLYTSIYIARVVLITSQKNLPHCTGIGVRYMYDVMLQGRFDRD